LAEDRVLVGTIGKPHGLDGTVVVVLDSDHPGRFSRGSQFLTEAGRTLTVQSSRASGAILLVRFVEVAGRDDAEQLRGFELTIDESNRRSLESGEFWPEQLVGLDVRDPDGRTLGQVERVDDSSAQHRLLVRTPAGVVMVPFVSDLVPKVEIGAGYLVVVPIAGLFEDHSNDHE
jgi:16S rRNA processing protein RimM